MSPGPAPVTQRFHSRLTTLLTMAGVAIGLGNVWRFPYMMGQNGGSAFLVIYLLMVILFAVPALCAEWGLGRHARTGTVGALSRAFGNRAGAAIGGLLVFGILIADSYYMVVVGNILFSAGFSIGAGFAPGNLDSFAATLLRTPVQYLSALLVLAAALWVIHRGLRHGIEAVSRLFVPFFGAVMLYLVGQTLMLEGALSELAAFLTPDFSRIGPRELFAAMGQACFSLGVGGTFMVIYGSFLADDEPILPGAMSTGAMDAGAAVLAGIFIVPAVLAFGLDLEAGPRLLFNTLPDLFATMPFGRLSGSLFLLALTFMAFLSAVAGLVVCLNGLQHLLGTRFSTGALLLGLGAAEALLMLPSAAYPGLIGHLDLVFGSGMQIFGAMMAVIAVAWSIGPVALRRDVPEAPQPAYRWLVAWLRWVVPPAFGIILIGYVYDSLPT